MPVALTINQQLLSHIDRSHRVVIAIAKVCSVDAVSSALALARSLTKKGKEVTVVCEGWNDEAKRQMGFLPTHELIQPQLKRLRRYAITVDVAKTPIEEVSYEVVDHTLSMYLQPLNGTLTKEDLVLEDRSIPVDWIVTIGAADLGALGTMSQTYADLFYSTPLLNIDHVAENEQYGQWQLIDVTSPSIAEIIFRFHDVLGIELVDEETATLMLAGIIASTRSFTLPTVTPLTLTTASRLMTLGGKREQIVKSLYWKRSVGSLKLFGKMLGRLHHDDSRKLALATITTEDLLETKTQPSDIQDVVEEVFHTSPDLDVLVALSPAPASGFLGFAVSRRLNIMELLGQYKSTGGPHRAHFHLQNASITHAQQELMEFLQSKIQTI